jgi:hypothetical protein
MRNRMMRLDNILILMFLLFFSACGGGGGGNDGSSSSQSVAPAADLTGTWAEQGTVNGNCAGDSYPSDENNTLEVSQSGSQLQVIYSSTGTTLTGTISGATVAFSGDIPQEGGTLALRFSGTLAIDTDSITGSSTWTWTDGSYSCSGTTDVVATKQTQAVQDVSGTWQGTWQSTVYSLSDTFSATITQNGNTLSGTISVPYIGMMNAQLTGTYTQNNITFGDINHIITFTGSVANDQNALTASGTYTYPSVSDHGNWQGSRN